MEEFRMIVNPPRAVGLPTESDSKFLARAETVALAFSKLTVRQMVSLCPDVYKMDLWSDLETFEDQMWKTLTKYVPEETKRHVRSEAADKQDLAEEMKRRF